ncbi:hypothetical protein B0T17DRAFT_567293 [Bombardia bombarda]|uniref:Thioesterase domain-containing protein n=1 Tax=Bombardia bombarda TaxID=252184 RepID=A0AA40CG25_9PEZI|nr:hypothetical protein B0T17DRAFT_567293 [Bombardia bombarda]
MATSHSNTTTSDNANNHNRTTNPPSPSPSPSPSGPASHNQFIKDPVAHFRSIPWCAALLNDPAAQDLVVPDRRPLSTGEGNFSRRIISSAMTIRASIRFSRRLKPIVESSANKGKMHRNDKPPLTASKPLLSGGGPANGEHPEKPFYLFNALLDLGENLSSYAGTLHGGVCALLLDEVMGTAANAQTEGYGAYTVQFNVDYKKPVKVFVRGAVEDRDGEFFGPLTL